MGRQLKSIVKLSLIIIVVFSILNFFFGNVCLSRILFGIPCPACGMTRSFILLIQFKFRESFNMHPLLIPVIFEIFLYLYVKYYLKKYRYVYVIYGIILIVIGFIIYIYRMRTMFPNIEPMTYDVNNIILKFINDMKRAGG